MIILSWNCRGLRKTTAVQRCKRLIGKYQPDFIFLSETKISLEAASSILNNLGYNNYVGTSACNLGGGTIVAWNKDYVVETIELSAHVYHCKVSSKENFLSCYFSFIYGPLTPLNTIFYGNGCCIFGLVGVVHFDGL